MSTYFKIAAKSVLALVIYFVLSSLLSVVVSSFWVTQMSQTGITPEEMLRLSETDGFLQLASALIGGCTLVLVAYLFTKVKKLRSTPAMFAFAWMLIAVGALSVVLHPLHHELHQVAKFIGPVLLMLWLKNQSRERTM